MGARHTDRLPVATVACYKHALGSRAWSPLSTLPTQNDLFREIRADLFCLLYYLLGDPETEVDRLRYGSDNLTTSDQSAANAVGLGLKWALGWCRERERTW